jgi:hypothetical protein
MGLVVEYRIHVAWGSPIPAGRAYTTKVLGRFGIDAFGCSFACKIFIASVASWGNTFVVVMWWAGVGGGDDLRGAGVVCTGAVRRFPLRGVLSSSSGGGDIGGFFFFFINRGGDSGSIDGFFRCNFFRQTLCRILIA